MKHPFPLLFLLLTVGFLNLSAQTDTTEYLFKRARYSYLQYHMGYSPMFFSNGQTVHGFSCELTGVVFNDKLALGFDIDGYAKQVPYTITSYPYITTWVAMSLNIEPLIRPRKVINFSFPVKLGWGGAQRYVLTQNSLLIENPQFFVVNPQAMVWVNLLKPLSLGAGASYRMCFNSDPDTFSDYGGVSAYATLRFKFYTKEWSKKMADQQREYMRMQQK